MSFPSQVIHVPRPLVLRVLWSRVVIVSVWERNQCKLNTNQPRIYTYTDVLEPVVQVYTGQDGRTLFQLHNLINRRKYNVFKSKMTQVLGCHIFASALCFFDMEIKSTGKHLSLTAETVSQSISELPSQLSSSSCLQGTFFPWFSW